MGTPSASNYLREVSAVSAAALVTGGPASAVITCTVAAQDYKVDGSAADVILPVTAVYLDIFGDNDFKLALGVATDTTHGSGYGAGKTIEPLEESFAGLSAAARTVHVQSPTAGAKIIVAWRA